MGANEALCYVVTWDGMRYHAQCRCCKVCCKGVGDGPGAAMRKAVAGCRLAFREEQAAKLNHWNVIDLKGE